MPLPLYYDAFPGIRYFCVDQLDHNFIAGKCIVCEQDQQQFDDYEDAVDRRIDEDKLEDF